MILPVPHTFVSQKSETYELQPYWDYDSSHKTLTSAKVTLGIGISFGSAERNPISLSPNRAFGVKPWHIECTADWEKEINGLIALERKEDDGGIEMA